MTALSDLLASRLPQGTSAREVARQAQRKGFDLKESTSTAYFGGRHGKSPRMATLEALAAVLPVTLEELQTAAGIPVGTPWEPNRDHAIALDADQRRVLDQLLSVMARQREDVTADDAAPKKRAGDARTDLDARRRASERQDDDLPADVAARSTGKTSRGQQVREEQDRDAGE